MECLCFSAQDMFLACLLEGVLFHLLFCFFWATPSVYFSSFVFDFVLLHVLSNCFIWAHIMAPTIEISHQPIGWISNILGTSSNPFREKHDAGTTQSYDDHDEPQWLCGAHSCIHRFYCLWSSTSHISLLPWLVSWLATSHGTTFAMDFPPNVSHEALWIETSAKSNENVELAFMTLASQISQHRPSTGGTGPLGPLGFEGWVSCGSCGYLMITGDQSLLSSSNHSWFAHHHHQPSVYTFA